MSEDTGEKSFEATPHRRAEFRKQGRFARARDAGAIVTVGACLGVVMGSRAAIAQALDLLFTRCWGDLGALRHGGGAGALNAAIGAFVVLAGPPAIAAAIAGTVIGFAQAGINVQMDLVSFKAERLNPIARLGQVFSPKRGAAETVMAFLRLGVVGYATYRAIRVELPGLLELSTLAVSATAERLTATVTRVTLTGLGALAVIALIDYAYNRYTLEKEMRMSHREILDETKAQEGDPKQKAKMRSKARALIRKRSIANVKKADVVVTNPTHVAVALRYGPNDPAPIVVAKGHDEVAMQIRAEARRHGIPMIENRPLARALDAEVPLGGPIRAAHFAAVARVLAFVYRLRRRGVGTQRAEPKV